MELVLLGIGYALLFFWALGVIVAMLVFAYAEGRSDADGGLDFRGMNLAGIPFLALFWPLIVGGKAFDIIFKNLIRKR